METKIIIIIVVCILISISISIGIGVYMQQEPEASKTSTTGTGGGSSGTGGGSSGTGGGSSGTGGGSSGGGSSVTPPPSFAEGDSVKCTNENGPEIYRYTNGKLRLYLNPADAASWNSKWGENIKHVSCTTITKGSPMSAQANLYDTVKCENSAQLYKYFGNGIIKYWSNPEGVVKTINCTQLENGGIAMSTPPSLAGPMPSKNVGIVRWANDTNKCMSVSNGMGINGSNGTWFTMWTCDRNDANQKFMPREDSLVWVNNGTISNKCMSVSDGMNRNGANGTNITLWDCNGSDPNMKFKIEGDKIKWVNNGSIANKCVSVSDGVNRKGEHGTPFTLWDCNDTDPNLKFNFQTI